MTFDARTLAVEDENETIAAEVHGDAPQDSSLGVLGASAASRPRPGKASELFSLWSPILLKGLYGALLLGLVAYLGHRSKDVALYGESVHLDLEERPPKPRPVTTQAMSDSSKSEPTEPPPCPREDAPSAPDRGTTKDGKVILNVANATELSTLPGVGASRAEAILALRTRLGKFKKKTDLLRIRGIGWRTFAKMKDRMVVDVPEDERDTNPAKDAPARNVPPSDDSRDAPADPAGAAPSFRSPALVVPPSSVDSQALAQAVFAAE